MKLEEAWRACIRGPDFGASEAVREAAASCLLATFRRLLGGQMQQIRCEEAVHDTITDLLTKGCPPDYLEKDVDEIEALLRSRLTWALGQGRMSKQKRFERALTVIDPVELPEREAGGADITPEALQWAEEVRAKALEALWFEISPQVAALKRHHQEAQSRGFQDRCMMIYGEIAPEELAHRDLTARAAPCDVESVAQYARGVIRPRSERAVAYIREALEGERVMWDGSPPIEAIWSVLDELSGRNRKKNTPELS